MAVLRHLAHLGESIQVKSPMLGLQDTSCFHLLGSTYNLLNDSDLSKVWLQPQLRRGSQNDGAGAGGIAVLAVWPLPHPYSWDSQLFGAHSGQKGITS
ncbi:hypothetical protein P7K49_030528 [Saguinus oedipus]|uniref:Uncharacterized protein n=1 Tax=Saguinus oedipus TaxID=9490 RepID=A0ABQ9U2F5_SAGOE|nr:hypothetical protein P7K49_030528 [Saguinus oedipus]